MKKKALALLMALAMALSLLPVGAWANDDYEYHCAEYGHDWSNCDGVCAVCGAECYHDEGFD